MNTTVGSRALRSHWMALLSLTGLVAIGFPRAAEQATPHDAAPVTVRDAAPQEGPSAQAHDPKLPSTGTVTKSNAHARRRSTGVAHPTTETRTGPPHAKKDPHPRQATAKGNAPLRTPSPHQPAAVESASFHHVYTNEDLFRFIRPEDAATGSVKSHENGDGEASTQDAVNPVREATGTKAVSDAQARLQNAQSQVDLLKRQALADSNPLVPPPGGMTEAEKAKRQGLPRDQVLQQTREQLKQAEMELQAAKSNLETVKANPR